MTTLDQKPMSEQAPEVTRIPLCKWCSQEPAMICAPHGLLGLCFPCFCQARDEQEQAWAARDRDMDAREERWEITEAGEQCMDGAA